MKTRPVNTAKGKAGRKSSPLASVVLAQATMDGLRARYKMAGDDLPFLQRSTGDLYVYNGAHWEACSPETAKYLLFQHASDPMRSTDRLRVEALKHIAVRCHQPDHEWGRVAEYEVPVANGVVDVRTMKLRPHRASDYIESVIPHEFKPHARHAVLDGYLTTLFGDGADQRPKALQAFAGYIVLPHARMKKAAVLYGPGDTGKSAFSEMMQALIGRRYCTSLSVEDMEDPIKRAVLVGKKLNTLTELPSDAIVRDGGFKTLVGTEEPVLINPKYGHPFQYVSQAKHLIATNTLPRINDRTDATINRLYIIPFNRVLTAGERDRNLLDRVRAEMSGVLWWALQGAKDLLKTGAFPPVDLADRRVEEMRDEANPVAGYVRQMMIEDRDAVVPVNEITRGFNDWSGGGRKLEIRMVSRMLRAAFGEDIVGKFWVPSQSATALAMRGWRLRTGAESAAVVDPD